MDAKRGILLTNRHVCTPGPIVAEAIFLNREELPVFPLYYDPVRSGATSHTNGVGSADLLGAQLSTWHTRRQGSSCYVCPAGSQVHDFAFLRFDPGRLQYMDVDEVPLAPEAAVVGLDIRVVGNDSGEKVRWGA